jgi:hypothetical protein
VDLHRLSAVTVWLLFNNKKLYVANGNEMVDVSATIVRYDHHYENVHFEGNLTAPAAADPTTSTCPSDPHCLIQPRGIIEGRPNILYFFIIFLMWLTLEVLPRGRKHQARLHFTSLRMHPSNLHDIYTILTTPGIPQQQCFTPEVLPGAHMMTFWTSLPECRGSWLHFEFQRLDAQVA